MSAARLQYGWLSRAAARVGEALSTGPAVAVAVPRAIVIVDRDGTVLHAGQDVERVLGTPARELIGARIEQGRLESRRTDGSIHLLEFSATPTRRGDVQVVELRDVTAHGGDGDVGVRDLRHATAAELAAPGRDVRARLDATALGVAAALSVDFAGIFEHRGARRPMLLSAGHGWHEGAVGRATVSAEPASPVGRALVGAGAVIIDDLRRSGDPVASSRLLHDHAVISGLQTRIGPPAAPWGLLGAYTRRPRRFELEDLDFLRVVADALAMAIENADLHERLGSLAAELECARRDRVCATAETSRLTERRTREQIMQLVHDEALQSLLAARQDLAAGPGSRDHMARAREGVERAIRELRDAIGGLHPVACDGRRLEETVRGVAGPAATAAGLRLAFAIDADADEECAPLLSSVIRELIANVGHHARASEVRVILRADGRDLVLEVCDDGVGITPGRAESALAEGHIGLASAARRVRAMGGRLELESEPRHGTCVRVTLPGRVLAAGDAGTGAGGGQDRGSK